MVYLKFTGLLRWIISSRKDLGSYRKTCDGNALITVLMAAGIFGVLAVTMSKMHVLGFKAQKKIENDSVRNQIRGTISQRISCEQTFAGIDLGKCNGSNGDSALIALKDPSGNLISSQTGNATKIGDFAIRAYCDTSSKEITVKLGVSKSAVPLNTQSDSSLFIKDPLTDQLMGWAHPKNDLFPSGAGLCKQHFGALDSSACNSSREGSTRYNSVNKQFEFCNGSDWKVPGTPDFIIAAQYHDEGAGKTKCGNQTPTSTNTGDLWKASCKRSFNSLLSNTGGHGSITSGGDLTLDPGNYYCQLTGFGYQSEQIRTYLQEVGGRVWWGDQQLSEDTNWTSVASTLTVQFTIGKSTTFQMWHVIRNMGLNDAGLNMWAGPGYNALMSCMRWN